MAYPYPPYPPYSVAPPPQPKLNAMSVWSFITSLLGVSIVGLILGIVSLGQVKNRGERGKGFSIAGIVLGAIGSLGWIAFWVIFAMLGGLMFNADDPEPSATSDSSVVAEPSESPSATSSSKPSPTRTATATPSTKPTSSTSPKPSSSKDPLDGTGLVEYTKEFCRAFAVMIQEGRKFDEQNKGKPLNSPKDLPPEFRASVVQVSDIKSPNQPFYRQFADVLLGNVTVSKDELNAMIKEFNRVVVQDAQVCSAIL